MARPTRRPGNLPAEATSFIGRRRELAELRKKLTTARLVSLVGPGGVGKTRLAIRIGTDLRRGFRDGAWLVELAEVRDPALVGNATLAALDLRDQAATEPRALLLSYLRDKELLLVVDNCEHLLGAAALLVTDVLKAAPGVRVIATSREPLSVPGEHVLPIPPLELPRAQADESLDQLRQNESVELFTERASAASGRFELTASNQAAVVDLCRRLDGLPLAIELAAVRTRVLSVEQILDRLADRFGLLTGGSRAALPRHQTLRTTIEWSHDLLGSDERTLLRRLCVFAGRFTLEDVESVCTSDDMPKQSDLRVTEGVTEMPVVTNHLAPDKVARITGGFYLAYIVASVLATALGQIGLGEAPQVYQAIVTNEGSFRLGLVIALTSGFLFLMVAWGLYVLLRPVNRNLALLFLLLNAVGVAIQGASMLSLVSALLQGDAASHMQAYSAAQLEGLAYLSINVYKTGWVTAQLFFGTWLFPLGYLVYKSRFLPRFLGVLLMLDGIAVLIWFLQALLLPDYPAIHYPGLVVSFVAELGLALWLLVKGVKVVDAGAGLPGEKRLADPQAEGARA